MNEISTLAALIPLLESVGFPLTVTLILLVRYEVRMERLERHSKDLLDTISKLRREMS